MILSNLFLFALLGGPVQASPQSVSGKVLDEAGKPIANAHVYVVRSERREQRIDQSLTTGADGAFHAKVEPNTDPQSWTGVLAVAEGHSPMYEPIAERSSVQLTLPEATTADIKLVAPDGKPAAQITVRPQILVVKKNGDLRPSFVILPESIRDEMGAKTDSTGVAHLAGVPKNGEVLLVQADERFAQLGYKERVVLNGTSSGPTVINLRPGCKVSGRVLDAEGKPASGIIVGAQGLNDHGWGEARSAADGSFTLTQLPEDQYNIALDLLPNQAEDWTAAAHEKVAVVPNKAVEGLEFRLTKGSIVEGSVVDEQGKPAAGAMVGVYGPAHPNSSAWVQSAVADSSGRYRLRVPAGEQRVYVMGWPAHNLGPQPMKDVRTTEGQTVTADLKIRVEPGK